MKARKLIVTASVVLAALGAGNSAASAQTDYVGGGQKDRVLGNDLSRNPGAQVDADDDDRGGALPVTGGDVLGLTVIGLGAVGAGTVLVRRSRRATSANSNA